MNNECQHRNFVMKCQIKMNELAKFKVSANFEGAEFLGIT